MKCTWSMYGDMRCAYEDMVKGKEPILWGQNACTISTEIGNRIRGRLIESIVCMCRPYTWMHVPVTSLLETVIIFCYKCSSACCVSVCVGAYACMWVYECDWCPLYRDCTCILWSFVHTYLFSFWLVLFMHLIPIYTCRVALSTCILSHRIGPYYMHCVSIGFVRSTGILSPSDGFLLFMHHVPHRIDHQRYTYIVHLHNTHTPHAYCSKFLVTQILWRHFNNGRGGAKGSDWGSVCTLPIPLHFSAW